MNKKEIFLYDRRLSYLNERLRLFYLGSILNVPLLILLWFMSYKIGFWVLIILSIIQQIIFSSWVLKQERKLNLE